LSLVIQSWCSCRFQSPCVVEQQLDPEDYVITLPDHQETKCVCHVNMLAKHHERDHRLDPWDRVGQSKHYTKFEIARGCWQESLEGDPVRTVVLVVVVILQHTTNHTVLRTLFRWSLELQQRIKHDTPSTTP